MKVDTTELINAAEVADLVGLANRSAVSVYRARYDDFPDPVIVKGSCMLWRRRDVEAWAKARERS